MTEAQSKTDAGWTGARLRDAPGSVVCTLVGHEVVACGLAVAALLASRTGPTMFLRLVILVFLCLVFEEISHQVGKLRVLISAGPLSDMTSVWTFAAALVLPAGYAAVFAVVVSVQIWLRRTRPSGKPPYLAVHLAATIILACMATACVHSSIQSHFGGLPRGLVEVFAIVMGAFAYTLVQRTLIIAAVRQMRPGTKLPIVGSWDDNALEIATLCLGAMTGIVLLHQPWVSPLVLLPMVLLQRGAMIKDLEQAATTDAKTGLLNATVWQGAARRELIRVDRDKSTAAVLILDLDHFKSVNDDHGHLFGDAALLAVGTRLKAEVRQYDVLGRFGGEEFVVLLPRISYDEATAAAERLRAAIASIVYEEFGDSFLEHDSPARARNLSVSIGVALYPEHGTDVDELLHKADLALYQAKRAGRNRVTVAAGDDTTI